LAVPDCVEARLIRRQCLSRAHRLWDQVVRGRHYSVSAALVLGALAEVRPLVLMADRPACRREWLERLVDVLAEDRLDRGPVAAAANAALAAVGHRLRGRRPAVIADAYVGVLATRFRRQVFGRRSAQRGSLDPNRLRQGIENAPARATMPRLRKRAEATVRRF